MIDLYRQAGLDVRDDLDTLAAAPRIAADPGAVAYVEQFAVFDGELRDPMLTLHTNGDQLAVVEHEQAYAETVERAGERRLLRQIFTERAGHCTFTPAETLTALGALLDRIDVGRWADRLGADELNDHAVGLGPVLNVHFDDESGGLVPTDPAFDDRRPAAFLRPSTSPNEDFAMITTDLIRLLDDVELLSPGRWTISGRQPVELRTTGWRRRRRPAFATGALLVDDDPRRSTLSLIVTPLDPELADATLTVNAVLDSADASGTWLLHGTAVRGQATTPITIDVQYRGVYPQQRRSTAWLTIAAPFPARGDELFGHLNADAPKRRSNDHHHDTTNGTRRSLSSSSSWSDPHLNAGRITPTNVRARPPVLRSTASPRAGASRRHRRGTASCGRSTRATGLFLGVPAPGHAALHRDYAPHRRRPDRRDMAQRRRPRTPDPRSHLSVRTGVRTARSARPGAPPRPPRTARSSHPSRGAS